MTDIVEKIEQIFAEDKPDRPPLKCPHCNRDWHPEPLTHRVACMWASHHYDRNYDPAEDDSPIVCVGANYQGPHCENRNRPWQLPGDFEIDLSSWIAGLNLGYAKGGALADLGPIPQYPNPFEQLQASWQNLADTLQAVGTQFIGLTMTAKLWLPPTETLYINGWYSPSHIALDEAKQIDWWKPLRPEHHYLRIDFNACSVYARSAAYIYPAERAAVRRLLPVIRSEVDAHRRAETELPHHPPEYSNLIEAIEKNTTHHHPTKGNHHHEGQRIPRRGPRRARRRMDTRNVAGRKR
ncbi:hypothetical protein [Mycolicibacterium goodii]|uniref:hypothetical protein n=1 Tax=Mycolicibacterium goodii TaxID=134601 RepID=UPI001BDC29F8|nr:hypothetical protein [Mycolicibacterium goodii]MBU8830852.1 hypothetical protein [Mycolicibacterium goodii]